VILRIIGLCLLLAGTVVVGRAQAADPVTIGAIYPLTGVNAAAGMAAKAAIEVGDDIVNTPHKGLDVLPLGAGTGLPNLDGAKVAVAFADDQSNPSVAVAQVLRLASVEHIAALIGAAEDATTLAATAEAERRGVPFLVPDATEPKITGRGLAWVFRTTPLDRDFADAYSQLLAALRVGGTAVGRVALVHETTARGASAAVALRDAAAAAGCTIVADIGYAPNGMDISAQVAMLRNANPDVAIFVGDAADSGLFVKTMSAVGYKPPLLIGDDYGFSDPAFVTANGNLAQGAISRSAWRLGDADSPTAIVNELYKARTGHDLDDFSARVLQGFLVLADAINRAGSVEPAAVRAALQQTDLKPDQLIVGYDGVKFDAAGQNTLGATYLTQLQGKKYVTIWPAATADAKLALPFRGGQP
jgi:branched-chain amino acid transport system substrate-binding protein